MAYSFTIVDINWKLISKGIINSNITRIDIGDFNDGKYLLNLQNSNSIISGYFILKHW